MASAPDGVKTESNGEGGKERGEIETPGIGQRPPKKITIGNQGAA